MPFPIDLDSPKTATSIGPLNYDDSPAEITTSQGPTEEIDYGFGPLDPNTTKITDLLRNMNKHQLQHLDEQDEDEVITWLKFRYDALLKAKRSGKKRPHSGSGYGDDERKNKAWMKPGVWMWGPVEDRITGSKGYDHHRRELQSGLSAASFQQGPPTADPVLLRHVRLDPCLHHSEWPRHPRPGRSCDEALPPARKRWQHIAI